MDELTINLSIDEINIVLNALGQQPYAQVAPLIEKIGRQGNEQLQGEVTEKVIDPEDISEVYVKE